MQLFLFLVVNLLMIFSHILIVQTFFNKDSLSEKILEIFTIFMSQITFTTLCLGVILERLNDRTLFMFNTGISLVIIFLLKKGIVAKTKTLFQQLWFGIKEIWQLSDLTFTLMVVISFIQVSFTLVKIYYLPPFVHDVLTTYLLPVVNWFQRERILTLLPLPDARQNTNRFGSKLISFWFVAFDGNLTLVEMTQFLFSFIIPIVAFRLIRKLGVEKRIALRYAVLIYFIPSILIESRTTQDHLTMVASFLIGLSFLINVIFEGKKHHWVLFGLSWGLFLGMKIIAPMYILITLFVLLVIFWDTRKQYWRLLKCNFRNITLAGFLIACIGGYWFARDLKAYGTLISGQLVPNVTGKLDGDLFKTILVFFNRFSENWLNFFTRISDKGGGAYTADLTNISGFGVQFFTFGLLGLVIGFIYFTVINKNKLEGRLFNLLFWSTVLIQFGYFAFYWTPYSYRLYMLTPIMALVFWAKVASRMQFTRTQTQILNMLFIVILIFNLTTCFFGENTSAAKLNNMRYLSAKERTVTNYSVHLGNDFGYIDHYLPANIAVGFSPRSLSGGDTFVAPYYDNQMNRQVLFLDIFFALNSARSNQNTDKFKLDLAELKDTLLENDISFIYVYDRLEPLLQGLPEFSKLYPHLYYFSP